MFAGILPALRSYPQDVRRIIAVAAIIGFTIDGVFPVIFNLYILRMGYGPDFVGLVNSVALVVFSFGSLLAGAVGMRFGARNTMVAGVAVSLFSTVALAVTDLLPAGLRPGWLMVMFSLLYLGVGLFFVNSAPAVVNLTPVGERARVVSVQSAIGNFLAFIGGPLAGFIPVLLAGALGWSLSDPGTYRMPLLISGAMFVLALAWILRVAPASGSAEAVQGEPSPERGAPTVAIAFGSTLAMLSIIRFLQAAGTGAGLTFFNVYMDDGLGVSPQYIGLMVAASRLLAVFAALLVPALVRKLGAANAAVAGASVVALSMLPLALVPIWWVGGAGFMMLNAATSVRYSAYFVYMMAVTPPRLRTAMAGAGEFSGGMAFAAISLVGGVVIVRYGYPQLFLAAGAITAVGVLLNWGYAAWRQGVEARHPAPTEDEALLAAEAVLFDSPATPGLAAEAELEASVVAALATSELDPND